MGTVRAWFTRQPWLDYYELRLASGGNGTTFAATGLSEDGQIVWERLEDELSIVPVLMRVPVDVAESFGRALGEITQASDQTVEALKDTRDVRDRLLTLVETITHRGGTN